jgi:hypothetical protein
MLDLFPAAVADPSVPALVRLRRFADLHAMPLACPIAACRRSARCCGPAPAADGRVPHCLVDELGRLEGTAEARDGLYQAIGTLIGGSPR